MYRLLSELWASAEEPVMNGAEKALLRARLEASWSESSLGLIELYAALGRHREAHTIFQDLYDLSETPLLLSNRAKARSIISRLWTESLNTSS
jgi:hypothetical protein